MKAIKRQQVSKAPITNTNSKTIQLFKYQVSDKSLKPFFIITKHILHLQMSELSLVCQFMATCYTQTAEASVASLFKVHVENTQNNGNQTTHHIWCWTEFGEQVYFDAFVEEYSCSQLSKSTEV